LPSIEKEDLEAAFDLPRSLPPPAEPWHLEKVLRTRGGFIDALATRSLRNIAGVREKYDKMALEDSFFWDRLRGPNQTLEDVTVTGFYDLRIWRTKLEQNPPRHMLMELLLEDGPEFDACRKLKRVFDARLRNTYYSDYCTAIQMMELERQHGLYVSLEHTMAEFAAKVPPLVQKLVLCNPFYKDMVTGMHPDFCGIDWRSLSSATSGLTFQSMAPRSALIESWVARVDISRSEEVPRAWIANGGG
jgi:hypothetical protein